MENVSCNLCGADAPKVLFSKWNLDIVKCTECGLCYTNPRQFSIEADDYFRGAYLSTMEENGVKKSGIFQIYREILERLAAYLVPGKLVDVGCAMGHFMRDARDQGWGVVGTECSPYAAEYGRTQHGLEIHAACNVCDAGLHDSAFDAAVLIEVAEHLPDPRQTFTEVFRVLKPGGVIYVTTPNFGSFRALVQREDWAAVIPTGHLYYFTAQSLRAMLQSVGFTGVKDLTDASTLSTEMQFALDSNSLRLNSREMEQLFLTTAEQDSGKITNGRAEGLVLWAVKPHSPEDPLIASVRNRHPPINLEGKLIAAHGATPEDQKVFYVQEGKRHWVTSVEWLSRHHMRIEETFQVSKEDLQSLVLGPALS